MENIPKPQITRESIKESEEFKQHRRQSFWQVYFPMLVMLAIFVTVVVFAVLVTTKGDPNGSNVKWSSLILMFFISTASIITLIITAILGFSIYYLGQGIRKTPEVTNKGKFYVNLAGEKIKQAMDAITAPIIKVGGAAKGVQQAVDTLKGKTNK